MSSFRPPQASRAQASSSSLVSNPKVFQTAGFAFCQAGDKGELAALWLCPETSPEDNILGTLRHWSDNQTSRLSPFERNGVIITTVSSTFL